MAKRKVYFFTIDLYNKQTGLKEEYSSIPDILKEIVNTNSIVDNNVNILDLTMVGDALHTTLDIYKYNYDHMFVRTSKQNQLEQ